MIVILEGIDNSGKTTLINKLIKETFPDFSCKVLNDKDVAHYKALYKVRYDFTFFARNVALLELAKAYNDSGLYHFVFIDRCFLSYAIYNVIKDCDDYELKANTCVDFVRDYCHIILYQQEIEAKATEIWSLDVLASQNHCFKAFADSIPRAILVAKEHIDDTDWSSMLNNERARRSIEMKKKRLENRDV